MSRRFTGAWVGCGAMVLALGSWMVSDAGADDENDAAAPSALPASAFLNGEAAPRSTRLDEIEVTVREVEEGYELTLVNASDAHRTVRWAVECNEMRGSMVSRMGPIPRRVHDEVAELRLPPNGRAVHLVRVAHPEAPRGEGFMRENVSMEIALRSLEASAPPRVAAVLRVPVEA